MNRRLFAARAQEPAKTCLTVSFSSSYDSIRIYRKRFHSDVSRLPEQWNIVKRYVIQPSGGLRFCIVVLYPESESSSVMSSLVSRCSSPLEGSAGRPDILQNQILVHCSRIFIVRDLYVFARSDFYIPSFRTRSN